MGWECKILSESIRVLLCSALVHLDAFMGHENLPEEPWICSSRSLGKLFSDRIQFILTPDKSLFQLLAGIIKTNPGFFASGSELYRSQPTLGIQRLRTEISSFDVTSWSFVNGKSLLSGAAFGFIFGQAAESCSGLV